MTDFQPQKSILTDYEAALYDRGIRLWGVDAQNRLRQSKVLFIGVNGLMSEVIKNVVLAGVDSVTIIDNKIVSWSDLGSNLFLSESSIGKKKSDESLSGIIDLNPLVNVKADNREIESIDTEFIKQFTVVCISDINLTQNVEKINEICRSCNIPFLSTYTFGYQGYYFSDLQNFNFVMKKESDLKKKENEEEKEEFIECNEVFSSFKQSITSSWSSTNNRTPAIYFGLSILYRFQLKHGRSPLFQSDADQLELESIIKETLSNNNNNLPHNDKYIESCRLLNKHLNHEMSPVCAIVGGIVGQEIIKIISKNNQVVNNFFFYDGIKGYGLTEKFN
eukprot:gene8510-10462_t